MRAHEIGDEHKACAWFTPGHKRPARKLIRSAFEHDTVKRGLKFTPVRWSIEDGEGHEKPGPDAKLLVGSAKIVGFVRPEPEDGVIDVRRTANGPKVIRAFFDDLEPKDQERLIKATQLAYAELNPGKPPLSVERCVEYIEMVGPDVWEKEIKAAVDSGKI